MAHIKLITPGSQDFGEPVAQLIKMSRQGLKGSDLDGFVKRASVEFLDKLATENWPKDLIPVHLIALGSTEHFGSNRNGDGFKEATCKECHPTFVKLARFYHDHANKDPSKGYGIVKASAYNNRMHRIELLVGLFGTKEAAERHGGLKADDEMEMLEDGRDIPVSMACRVAFDKCAACGNEAKTRADYCGPESCTKYGGCRDNLAKTFDDGFTLHVDNPNPSFFDISKVFKPADRTAYVLGRAKVAHEIEEACSSGSNNPFGMLKAASAGIYGEHRSSSYLAEKLGITAPLWLLSDGPWSDPRIVGQMKIASALMELEAEQSQDVTPMDRAFHSAVQPGLHGIPENIKTAQLYVALAAQKCLLPLADFLLMETKSTKTAALVDQVKARLPGVFTRLASDPQLETLLQQNPYLPSGPASSKATHWALKCAKDYSLDRNRVIQRLQLSTIREPQWMPNKREMCKIASVSSADKLAREYALYQLGLLHSLANEPDQDFRIGLVVRSNFM